MVKPLIQDIVRKKSLVTQTQPEKKEINKISINKILVSKEPTRAKKEEKDNKIKEIEKIFKKKTDFTEEKIEKNNLFSQFKLKIILSCAILLFLLAIGIFGLFKFSSVVIEIIPYQKNTDININLQASINPQKEELPLEVMQISRAEKGTAVPTLVKKVSQKASGKVIIYNSFSSQSQTLVNDTRLQTPEGKIYRLNKTIIIPGAKIDGGKITPSETEVMVYADKPGEEYNIDLTDFLIPGFKDPAKREKIYGRSKTKIEGGFIGEAPVIAQEDIDNLKSSLKNKLDEYLTRMAVNPKPENFLFYENAKKIIYEQNKNEPNAGEMATQFELEEKATFFGFLLKKEDIGRILAEKYFNQDESPNLLLINAENLSFELKEFGANNIKFNLIGSAHFIFKIDEEAIKKDIIAGEKNPFQKYSAIDKAKIVFKPSWWHILPKNPSKISIFVNTGD